MSPHPVAAWGVCVIETDVDRALIATLREWLPTYLKQLELERDDVLQGKKLARPKPGSFQNVLDDDEFPEGGLPAVLVTTSRMDEVQAWPNLNSYGATWVTRVSVVVRGQTGAATREIAALFAGAVRRILKDQPLPIEARVHLVGGSVAPVADVTEAKRYLAAGVSEFRVEMDDVLDGDGPVSPTPDDPQYPDPHANPDEPFDPLAVVRGVTTTITTRS